MSTNELYYIYKARKEYLKELKHNIIKMDLMTEKGRGMILAGIEYELGHIQTKIDNLMWQVEEV